MTPSLSSLLWFIAILIAIPALLWLLRQSPLGRLHGLRPGGAELPLRTVSSLALSPSQRVVTIEVGEGAERRWLVLGVTPGSISTLHQLQPGPQPAPAQAQAFAGATAGAAPGAANPAFAQLLARFMPAVSRPRTPPSEAPRD